MVRIKGMDKTTNLKLTVFVHHHNQMILKQPFPTNPNNNSMATIISQMTLMMSKITGINSPSKLKIMVRIITHVREL